tara:strand:+ start:61 stop:627 length:567 start_codon:yes stop_codon:yes gene_type:complete
MDILLVGYNLSWGPGDSGKDIDDTIRDAQTDINVTALYEDPSLDKVYDFHPYDSDNTQHQKITTVATPDKMSGLQYIQTCKGKFDFIQLPLFGLSEEVGTIAAIFKLLKDNGKLITFQDTHQSFVESELQTFKYTKSLEDISVENLLNVKVPQPNVPRVVYKIELTEQFKYTKPDTNVKKITHKKLRF